jgi:two-component system sensor histidine kinase KdpD
VELVTAERHGPLPGGDEIGRVGASVLVGGTGELVVAWLEGRIPMTRDQLVDDATEIFLAVGEVVARRIELLGAVERQRSALLRSVSHDLRTPLASIRAAASTLAVDGNRYATNIEEEAERLDRLVANLLSLSRIEAGAYVVARQSVDVAELIDATTSRLGRLFTAVRLDVDLPADLPFVRADHSQLDQLLTNLLENAARHTPPVGTVHLAASVDDRRHLVLTVADEGPGVAADEVAGLFEPFRTGAVPGASGIGLAICKAVVDGHGGTIAVRDRPGGGAVFTVALPLG